MMNYLILGTNDVILFIAEGQTAPSLFASELVSVLKLHHADPNSPEEWWSSIKERALEWNKAFSYAGLFNQTVQVVTREDSDWPNGYILGDSRCSSTSGLWALLLSIRALVKLLLLIL